MHLLCGIYRNYNAIGANLRYVPHDLSQIWLNLNHDISQGGGCELNTKEAVAKRILELCEERNMAVNALATVSGVSPSTIYSMLNEKSKNPGVVSLKKLCDGLEISIREFFNSELFDDLEQEIK